jgi:hypothetical protein
MRKPAQTALKNQGFTQIEAENHNQREIRISSPGLL